MAGRRNLEIGFPIDDYGLAANGENATGSKGGIKSFSRSVP
jgi:hypothetical protein